MSIKDDIAALIRDMGGTDPALLLVHEEPTYDPGSGSVVPVATDNIPVWVALAPYRYREVDGNHILHSDMKAVLVPSDLMTERPKPQDQLNLSTDLMTVVSVKTYSFQGEDIAHVLQVRS